MQLRMVSPRALERWMLKTGYWMFIQSLKLPRPRGMSRNGRAVYGCEIDLPESVLDEGLTRTDFCGLIDAL
jgi:hypothetical protein